MKIIYFSWLKETLGTSEENIKPPANIKNIDKALIDNEYIWYLKNNILYKNNIQYKNDYLK